MIDEQVIVERIKQLQAERAKVERGIQRMAAEMERGGHLLSSYDGAIGELMALVQPPVEPTNEPEKE